jgi:hypothetical protein
LDNSGIALLIEHAQAHADARSANRTRDVRGSHRLDGVIIGANLLRV